jgi:PAS domain S-box-containing protein
MTTDELVTALHALKCDDAQDLVKQLHKRQLELESRNRELLETHEQLVHSRIRYADLYDFSPIGYASLDLNGVIEEINITGGKMLGGNPHGLTGACLADFIAPEDIESFNDHLRLCRLSRAERNIELTLTPPEGPAFDAQIFTAATQDADRRTFQFRMAIIDITMRKRAEAACLDVQKRLEQAVTERTAELQSERRQREEAERFLYEASSVLSMSLDHEVTLLALARAAIPHLADACVVDMLRDDGSIQRVAVAHARAAKEDELRDTERVPIPADVIRTGQAELRCRFIAAPLLVRGKVVGAIRLMLEREDRSYNPFDLALAEDLADRAAIALENARLYTNELEANRVKDEFLATVSHELRTPLTPIFGEIYRLRNCRPDDQDLQKVLDVIERNAKAQATIVEELLDVSRITTGKLDFNCGLANLTSIVESAVAAVRPSAEVLGIRLETSLDPASRLIWCDPDRIKQAIWNLAANAIKFSRQGASIEIRLENTPEWAHIRISDTGIGISPESLPHIFEQFRQTKRFSTRLHGGLGMGLSIVRYIVERHGGTVRAESSGEGQGAAFFVDLPYFQSI